MPAMLAAATTKNPPPIQGSGQRFREGSAGDTDFLTGVNQVGVADVVVVGDFLVLHGVAVVLLGNLAEAVALLDGVRAGARRGEGSCRHKCTSVMVLTDIRTTGYVLRAMKGTATKAATTERANMIAS